MEIRFSDRVLEEEAGIFQILNDRKSELLKEGRKLYDMSIGTPDFAPPSHVVRAVREAASKPENYKYAMKDMVQLQEALISYYRRRYQVDLKQGEMTSVSGTQEGMAHIFFTLCNPGDYVLVPNPGYPIFSDGAKMAGARLYPYPLLEENGYLPKLDEIPKEIRAKAKVMVVSYPLNPIGVTAPDAFYDELIDFAKENQIVIINDNAYSDIVFCDCGGKSFLSHRGAKEVGMEFFSLSKSFNMTGARISFAVGNADIIKAFKSFRSNIDYGLFLPVQYGAIAALNGDPGEVQAQCDEYKERSRALTGGFRKLGWDVTDAEGSMFVWAKIPAHYKDCESFCSDLMEKAGVICTPGSSFGTLGTRYVRFALVLPVPIIEEVVEAVRKSGVVLGESKH